jgi:hypothetical protein
MKMQVLSFMWESVIHMCVNISKEVVEHNFVNSFRGNHFHKIP